jgi:transcriptional regulator with XRE-family HTH domain
MDKTIANAERGRSTLTDASLARLARALNVHPSDLLVGSAGQYRPTPWDSALRRRRHELHLTSLEAAARIGISRTTLLRAEAGSNIHRESAYKIARFYDLDILEVAPRLAQGAQYDGGTR